MKILIIADDPEIAENVSLAFGVGRPGTEVVSVSSQGLNESSIYEVYPDAAFVELGLQAGAGFEAIKTFRSFSDVAIIAVADRQNQSGIPRALKLGANDSVLKPFELMEILIKVCSLVEKKRIKHQTRIQPRHKPAKANPPRHGMVTEMPRMQTDLATVTS
ncbi:MAG: response regulator [Dehalogenimonas sp.]